MTESIHIDQLMDYASGFVQRSPQNLALLFLHQDWQAMARLELNRRAAAFIQLLPDEILHAIAAGELVIPDLAQKL